jgi:hypothetical protein
MGDEPSRPPSEANAELERELRKGRKFTLTEAIGRLAGPGAMKGVSPITRKQQSAVEIEETLKQHLVDAQGILQSVLLRQIKGSELFLNHFDQPRFVLASYLQRVLESDYLLKEIVQETDIEWGRVFGERPFFDKQGCPPDPDDPYTIESVRHALSHLLDKLIAGES